MSSGIASSVEWTETEPPSAADGEDVDVDGPGGVIKTGIVPGCVLQCQSCSVVSSCNLIGGGGVAQQEYIPLVLVGHRFAQER